MGDLLVWKSSISKNCESFFTNADLFTRVSHFSKYTWLLQPLADVVKHVEKGYRMEAPEGCPPEIYEIMREAWDIDPDIRPTFSVVSEKLNQFRSTIVSYCFQGCHFSNHECSQLFKIVNEIGRRKRKLKTSSLGEVSQFSDSLSH